MFVKVTFRNWEPLGPLLDVEKFVVVEPKIIMRSQRLYGVERDFSD